MNTLDIVAAMCFGALVPPFLFTMWALYKGGINGWIYYQSKGDEFISGVFVPENK